ncbi:MAG: hypothetical protein KC653_02035, partial [Candidatus Andersenbacteria bacterium]|nr:hypothetical protein [Candidatus Andersenbacteria bacterium]
VGLTEETWEVIKQFAAADPDRYEGIRTEENEFIYEFNEAILSDYDGNPYFGVNEVFGGALEINPRDEYAISVGSANIKVVESDLDNFVFDIRVRGYEDQENLVIEQRGNELEVDIEGEVVARTTEALVIENGRVFLQDSEGKDLNPVELLPRQTSEKILSRFKQASIVDLALIQSISGDAEYLAIVEKQGNLFGLLPVTEEVEVNVDAETENVEQIVAPWWDIFVF